MGYTEQAKASATIMAIATAVPSYFVYQADFPDYYFRLSGCDHMTKLKQKFVRICKSYGTIGENSSIMKRHMHLTEEMLIQNPTIMTYDGPSLNARQEIAAAEVPNLAKEAASKAIEEWGRPASRITHFVFSSIVSGATPGIDVKLTNLLGLDRSVRRVPLYQQGCYGGATSLRVAKDLAENNAGARVLVVCADNTISCLRGPSHDMNKLVGHALFADGASAAIVGSNTIPSIERPIFHIAHASTHLIPDSEAEVVLDFRNSGLIVHVSGKLPLLIANNIEKCLVEAVGPSRINHDWNSLFWAVHPGGPKILDMIEGELGLKKEKLEVTRAVLREYGNMIGACSLFLLDKMRRKSIEAGMATTGEGLEKGVLLGFGPGLTVEAVVLRGVPISK